MSDPFPRLTSFLAELKRRRVYRVAVVYAAVAFILLQGVDLMADPLGLPGVVMTVLVVATLFGFPLALVLAWAFEVTPEGVRKTEPRSVGHKDVDSEADTAQPVDPKSRGVGGIAVLLGVGVLVAGAVGWWLLTPTGDTVADFSGIRSVAVLPLENFSGEPGEEPFVSGMHEELINQLSQVGALLVTSRTSVMRYRGGNVPSLPDIGRELGVDAILEGSVYRVDDQVRITVQLIHAPTDTHLWSDSFVRELRDVLALHSEVARAVAHEVHAVLTPEESRRLASTREVDPRALEHYVRGRYLWSQRGEGTMREALAEFQAALEIDSAYAQAWSGIADTYVVPAGSGLAEDGRARGIEAARRALTLDSTLAEAHTSLAYGLVGEWAWQDAERHFHRAIALNPSYATAHQWYAELLAAQNRMDEAVASARRATVRDPLSPIIAWNLARALYFARRPHEALEQLRRASDSDHRDPMIGTLAYVHMGQPDSAWAHLLDSSVPPPPVRSELERLRRAGVGPVAAMGSVAREALETAPDAAGPDAVQRPPEALLPVFNLWVAIDEGRLDHALDRLAEAIGTRGIGPFIVDVAADPFLDPIRGDPRYRELLRETGLAEYWPADVRSPGT
jgi:TolB-like protein/tetratricopeptide (TPR) repeat protein